MAKVKGLTFADMRAYVSARGGPFAWDKMLAKLPPQDRALLDEVIAVGWYELDTHVRMLDEIPGVLGRPTQETLHDYARFCVERHVSRMYRVFFLVANPAIVLEKAGEYWSRFYDTGEWKIRREGDHRAHGDLAHFARPSATFCEYLGDYVGCLFERVGCKDVRWSHVKCRLRGDAVCSYTIDWR